MRIKLANLLASHTEGWVFVLTLLANLAFWSLLPASYRVNPGNDFIYHYQPVARQILAGEGITYADGSLAARYPPGYPLLLAGVYGLAHAVGLAEDIALDVFILFCAACGALLLYHLARQTWVTLVALLVVGMWITYLPALWLAKQPNSEMPFLVVFFGTLLLFWKWLHADRFLPAWGFCIGLLVGAGMLIRPISLGLVFILAVSLFLIARQRSLKQRILATGLLLLGNLIVVLPWEIWVYQHIGRIILLSTNDVPSMLDGLTFGLQLTPTGYSTVSEPLMKLMQTIKSASSDASSIGSLLVVVARECLQQPAVGLQLLGLKMVRSLYASGSQQFDRYILLLQIPYLAAFAISIAACWRKGGKFKNLTLLVLMITSYFWVMTVLGLSIMRYMMPAIALLFLLTPILIMRWLQNFKAGAV